MLDKLIDEGEIQTLVEKLGRQLTNLHDPCVWIVMDGGFMFAADLLRKAKGIRSVQFVYVERGYDSVTGPHHPHVYHMHHGPVFLTKYNHVFVDVVVEEGLTFEKLLSLVPDRQRPSVTTCALIVKGDAYTPTWVGKRLGTKEHLTGYGMLPYRSLSYIAERREK